MTREVQQWSDQIDMSDVDRDMFQSSSNDVSDFMAVVTSFIATLVDTIVPTVKVRSDPNGHWSILTPRTPIMLPTTLDSGHMDEYKAVSYGLQQVVK